MVSVQDQTRSVERVVTVRCPECGGLRGVSLRHADAHSGRCKDCRSGRCITVAEYRAFWLEHFSMAEIREMGQAIWG